MEFTKENLEAAMRKLTENYNDTLEDLFTKTVLALGTHQIKGNEFLKVQQFLTYYFMWELSAEQVGDVYKMLGALFPTLNPAVNTPATPGEI